jgi:hypothetical protein
MMDRLVLILDVSKDETACVAATRISSSTVGYLIRASHGFGLALAIPYPLRKTVLRYVIVY